MMKSDRLNKLVEISLRIANYVDEHGRNGDTNLGDELGLGYRALSSYLREGVKSIIDIQADYQLAIVKKELAEIGEQEMRDFLTEIFGDEEPETLNNEYKRKIKESVGIILKEMEEQ